MAAPSAPRSWSQARIGPHTNATPRPIHVAKTTSRRQRSGPRTRKPKASRKNGTFNTATCLNAIAIPIETPAAREAVIGAFADLQLTENTAIDPAFHHLGWFCGDTAMWFACETTAHARSKKGTCTLRDLPSHLMGSRRQEFVKIQVKKPKERARGVRLVRKTACVHEPAQFLWAAKIKFRNFC